MCVQQELYETIVRKKNTQRSFSVPVLLGSTWKEPNKVIYKKYPHSCLFSSFRIHAVNFGAFCKMEIFSAHEKMIPCVAQMARPTATSVPCVKLSCECTNEAHAGGLAELGRQRARKIMSIVFLLSSHIKGANDSLQSIFGQIFLYKGQVSQFQNQTIYDQGITFSIISGIEPTY